MWRESKMREILYIPIIDIKCTFDNISTRINSEQVRLSKKHRMN